MSRIAERRASAFTAEDGSHRGGVLGRSAAAQVGRVTARDAELERVDLALPHVSVGDLADEVRARRRQLVDPTGAVDDECAARAELREHLRDRAHERRRVDADHLRPRSCGVRQRSEQVEDRSRRELPPHRRRVAHRGVVRRREQEAEAELVDRAFDSGRRQLEPEAERLEHVRGAGGRRDRAVAVLGDSSPGRRRDEGRGRRDVDRARAVAARAGGVDQVVPLGLNREHVRAHRLGAARDLVGGLALQPQRDEEAADLRRRSPRRHDLVHHLARLCPREVVAVEQPGERLLHRHRALSRKFFASSGPTGVSTDSGWNWTPSTGSSRWRTAITSPLGARGRDLEAIGDARRRERVVAAGLERLGEAVEEAAAVVVDRARLAVDESLRLADLAAEGLDDRLVAEADAERRHARGRAGGRSRATRPRPAGRPGPGETTRCDGPSRSASSASIASLRRTTTSAPSSREEVREVVGERVVVVDQQDHARASASSIAISRAASLPQALVVLGRRVGVGHDARAGLEERDAVVQHDRPDRDAGVESPRPGSA